MAYKDRNEVAFSDGSTARRVCPTSGLPTYGHDAIAALDDSYDKVLDAPARETHYAHISVGANGAIVSFDAGTTDHIAIPADTNWLLEGLIIPASAEIHGKNLTAGSDYADLRISVW